MFGHLLLNEKETEAVNRIRAERGDPPTRFGTTSPTEASGVKLGAWEDEEVAKELVLLNAEREAAGEVPILPSWSTSTCKLDYGKNRDQYWRCPHIKLHLEQHHDMFEFKCPEHEPIVVKVPIPSSLPSSNSLFKPAWLGMILLFSFAAKLATVSLPPFRESILDWRCATASAFKSGWASRSIEKLWERPCWDSVNPSQSWDLQST
jgi:hypothetical protein